VSEGVLITPDVQFIRGILSSGGKDLKKCMQCGTCSVVCELALQNEAFPRKQMFQAQWGLKEKLLGDPAVWLCHNCGDCSTYCPRDARPGDVFGALRQAAIRNFSWPGFVGKMVSRPGAFLLLLIVPVLLLWMVALPHPHFRPAAEAEFADMFPIPSLEALFFAVSGFVLLAIGIGLTRFMKALRGSGTSIVWSGILAAVVEIMAHVRFSKCGANRSRRWGHLFILWGFVGLGIMGTIVGIGSMAGVMHTPIPMANPLKIFANIAAAAALVGCILLLVSRIQDPVARSASTYFDWFFLLTLSGVVLTGFLSEVLRLTQTVVVMYGVYVVHLLLILLLLLYAPYSKFAHMLYRTVAMLALRPAEAGKGVLTTRKAAAGIDL
jgi:quinone-modifying oxidoreductase subunit QmoC